ncbi:MAG: class I SAM-dependent methyltransferase [Gaiellaceae bacterium]
MRRVARAAARLPSEEFRREIATALLEYDPSVVLEAVGAKQNREPRLERMPLDLEPDGRLEFEDLAGLFASSVLNHGIVGMTIRQVAYIFGWTRRTGVRRAIEIGRWRGGTTVALAAAMGSEGTVWSIDVGEKAMRVLGADPGELDREIREFCERFDLRVELLVGDSRTIEVETGPVDLVVIDGDHGYEGVRSDFERFGRRVRRGGSVILDDAFDDLFVPSHPESVGRLVGEIVSRGDFRLEHAVDRLAHLVRLR